MKARKLGFLLGIFCMLFGTACLSGGGRGGVGVPMRGGVAGGIRGGYPGFGIARGAGGRGGIGSLLESVTRGRGMSTATFRLDTAGRLYSGAKYLGRINSNGSITRGSLKPEIIGNIRGNMIYETTAAGTLGNPVGQFFARTVTAASLRYGQGLARSVARNTNLEVLRVQSNWFEVRLEDATIGWLPLPAMGFSVESYDEETDVPIQVEVQLIPQDESEERLEDLVKKIDKLLEESNNATRDNNRFSVCVFLHHRSAVDIRAGKRGRFGPRFEQTDRRA